VYKNGWWAIYGSVEMAGMGAAGAKALGIAVADFDRDGTLTWQWPMIQSPVSIRNKGNGTFEDTALLAGTAVDDNGQTYAGMEWISPITTTTAGRISL